MIAFPGETLSLDCDRVSLQNSGTLLYLTPFRQNISFNPNCNCLEVVTVFVISPCGWAQRSARKYYRIWCSEICPIAYVEALRPKLQRSVLRYIVSL